MSPKPEPVEVAFAALMEVGRRDLALLIQWFDDDGDGYIEVNDDILSEADWALVDKAETLARASIGLPPMIRT